MPAKLTGRVVWIALVLGLLLGLPALATGFSNDDLLHRLELEGQIPGYEHAWASLYDFTPPNWTVHELQNFGYLPWFSSPELSLRFFRPLSSLLLAFDHLAFGRNAVLAHAHSLVWFALLVGLTAALYARWFSRAIATWSAVIYATAGLHAMSSAWLAARHSMVSSAFAVLALWAHARFHEDGWRAGPFVTALALVAGLSAGETALGAFAFLAAYEIARPAALASRVRGAATFVVCGLAYLAIYVLAGYGAKHSAMYVSPLSDPIGFVRLAPARLALLIGQLIDGLPSELPTLAPATTVPLVVVSVGVSAALLVTLVRLRALLATDEQRQLLWLGGAAAASLIPVASTMPGGRLLPLALVGTAPLVGSAFVLLARARPRWRSWPMLGALGSMHLFISPAWRLLQTLTFREFAVAQRDLALNADIGRCGPQTTGYLVTGADPSLSIYAGPALRFHTPEHARGSWRMLSVAPQDQRLSRVGPSTIELEVLGVRTSNQFEGLYSDRGVRRGDRVTMAGLDARVLADDAGLFTRARFELAGDLDGDKTCILAWRGKRLVAVAPPRIGESIVLRHEPGPMGL